MSNLRVIGLLAILQLGQGVLVPGKVIDLTYPLNDDPSKMFRWPTEDAFNLTVQQRGPMGKNPWVEVNAMCLSDHAGTHLDAPSHFSKGRWRVHQIPAERFVGPALVVDIMKQSEANADYEMTAEDLQEWEEENGRIDDGAILLMKTGWGQYWPDPVKFWGNDKGDTTDMHFPGIGADAARDIYAVGTDAPSLDYGQRKSSQAHQVLMSKNIYGLEQVANMNKVPTRGGVLYALPMYLTDGSGAPVRILLTIDSRTSGSVKNGAPWLLVSSMMGVMVSLLM